MVAEVVTALLVVTGVQAVRTAMVVEATAEALTREEVIAAAGAT
jgi:hypothetical protein